VAQTVVAVPLVTFVAIFGFTRSDAVNVAIGILGYYSLIVAGSNLVPVRPLDGAKAWYLFPELIQARPDSPDQAEARCWMARLVTAPIACWAVRGPARARLTGSAVELLEERRIRAGGGMTRHPRKGAAQLHSNLRLD